MKNSKEDIYLLTGDNHALKKDFTEKVKGEFISPGFEQLDFESIYFSDDPSAFLSRLKQALDLYPVGQRKRVVLIKQLSGAGKEVLDSLKGFLEKDLTSVVVLLDAEGLKDTQIDKLSGFMQVKEFTSPPPPEIKDLLNAVKNKKLSTSLKLLHSILETSTSQTRDELLILGGLIGQNRWQARYLSGQDMNDRFRALARADQMIKQEGIKPKLALELLIFKMCGF